jgi:Htaa protein
MADAAPLSWGLKESFRNYVEGAGGTIEVGGGASRAADGTFAFAPVDGGGLTLGADGKPQGVAQFTGEVKCEAHGGMLKVFLADPAVEIGPEAAVITAADSAARDRRVALAILDLAAATRDGDSLVVPTKLSKDGWRIIGDHYLPSTPLDPVRIRVGG